MSETLSHAQVERLHLLMEECAEVIQACSKVLRFGFDQSYQGSTNRQQLEVELGQVEHFKRLLIENQDVSLSAIEDAAYVKSKTLIVRHQ